jgi:flavin reductase (DIM6/NTAB) family NADH-FMN oxidoreductase RutF
MLAGGGKLKTLIAAPNLVVCYNHPKGEPMPLQTIPFESFDTRIFHRFEPEWLLLTSGDFSSGHFNAMTISWGFMGIIWHKPVIEVVVRPPRYTFEFMNRYDTFTVCGFPEKYKKVLSLLGSQSGRDGDKIKASGLTPAASEKIAAPCFAEADLIFECQKIYWQDLDGEHILAPGILENYPNRDFHRAYFGEILTIRAAG